MNRVILIGNLTRDPERRTTRSGVTTCSFTLAVERDHKDKDGNRVTDYITVIAWRNTAYEKEAVNMGKNNWPDFDAIIQKAVNAGRAQGMSIAKDAYKATERRLYALPVLRQKVEDDKEKLEQIKTHGAPERSKSIVRFSRTGYRLTPEEMLEAIIKDLEATIAADEYEIETLEKALAHIEDDPFYPAVEAKYIDGLEDDDIAADLKCGNTQLWKQRGRLVRAVAVLLYGSQASM